ncbi:MAG: hypothetical protein WKF87_06950 [Chryseolinea sp.]
MAGSDYRDDVTGIPLSAIWRRQKCNWNRLKITAVLSEWGIQFEESNGLLKFEYNEKFYVVGLHANKVNEKGTNLWVPFSKWKRTIQATSIT